MTNSILYILGAIAYQFSLRRIIGVWRTQVAEKKWLATTTVGMSTMITKFTVVIYLSSLDQVYQYILEVAIEGHEDQYVPTNLLLPSEVAGFNATISTFRQTDGGEIGLSDLIQSLAQSHPNQASLIKSAQSCLEDLIRAYARFPFSQSVLLTRSALLRAILFLTRGPRFFLQKYIEPHHSVRDQLVYIFEALANPGAASGPVKHENLLAVLVRMPYPLQDNELVRCPLGRRECKDMIQRLDPLDEMTQEKPWEERVIQRNDLKSFMELVMNFTGPGVAAESTSGLSGNLSCQQFLEWSMEQNLLAAMDTLFKVLLKPDSSLEQPKLSAIEKV